MVPTRTRAREAASGTQTSSWRHVTRDSGTHYPPACRAAARPTSISSIISSIISSSRPHLLHIVHVLPRTALEVCNGQLEAAPERGQ